MEENKNGTQEQPEQKKKKKSDVILTIALVVAIAVFCYAAYNLYHIYTEYRKGTNEYNSIEEMAVTERDPDSTEAVSYTHLDVYKRQVQDPHYILDTISDGFVVYGGIIGGILAGCLYCYIKKTDFWKYFDLVMPSVALAQGFGRIGCLLAGCCYGRETNSIFSITFQNSDFAPNHVALIPTQDVYKRQK